MISEAFDLIGTIARLSKADQKLITASKKSWVTELKLRFSHPQSARPRCRRRDCRHRARPVDNVGKAATVNLHAAVSHPAEHLARKEL